MNFSLTDDQQMIRDAAETFLQDACDTAALRQAIASTTGVADGLWSQLASELGWCALIVPEDCGGMGLGAVELALVLEQCGRRLLPAPFFSTAVGSAVLLALGDDGAQAELLGRIAAGDCRLALCTALHQPPTLTVTADGHLNGRIDAVPDALVADVLLVPARGAQGTLLFRVDASAAGVTRTPLDGWDLSRRLASVEFSDASASAVGPLAGGALAHALALCRLCLAAEQLGQAQQCLDLTVAYVSERKQFGRPVGSFQAVKHRCAELMVDIESLRSAVYGAAALAASGAPEAELAVECAMARSLARDTALRCAGEAIQLHGGVGFTWEYDPQLYFKRARAAAHWFGTAPQMRAEIAASLFGDAA